MGGFYKTFEVQINPEELTSYELTLSDVIAALENNNLTAGGGYIVHHGEQRFVRGEALLRNREDIENVVVKSRSGGLPILIKDVGDVVSGTVDTPRCSDPRRSRRNRHRHGDDVKGREFAESRRRPPKNHCRKSRNRSRRAFKLDVIYDRSQLINRTLNTVLKNLLEGGTLVIVILFLLLGNFRAGLVVALAIPLSMLFASNFMMLAAISASLMSLGAIDFGLIVDSSVIMIENCMRRLSERSQALPLGKFLSPVERMTRDQGRGD